MPLQGHLGHDEVAAVAQDLAAREFVGIGCAARNRRHQRQHVAVVDRDGMSRHRQVANVLVAQEDVDEAANATTVVEQLPAQVGALVGQRCQRGFHGVVLYTDVLGAANIAAKRGRNKDRDGH